MARKPVVSRKMVVTVANAMCVDTEKGEVFQHEVTIKGAPKKETTLNNAIKRAVEKDGNVKFVKVLTAHEEVKKAYMPMEEFLANCMFE